MRITRVMVIFLFILALLQAAPTAAAAPVAFMHVALVDASTFPQVQVQLSAWNADGLAMPALNADDFLIQEDGGAVFHPETVSIRNDSPLWVALVIDVSGSMQGKPMEDARLAATRFVDRLSPNDHLALVSFSDKVIVEPFSTDREPVYNRIDTLQAEGGTRLYDALVQATGLFGPESNGHRALLILSDGKNESASIGDPGAPVNLAQKANLPCYVLGLGTQVDQPFLNDLAGKTGGLLRMTPRSAELAHLFEDMGTLLKTRYEINFISRLNPDGKMHQVSLSLDSVDGSARAEIKLGPLPAAKPTAAATATTPPLPTSTLLPPSATPGAVQPVPASVTSGDPPPTSNTREFSLVGLLVVAVGVWLVWRSRRKKVVEDFCARCGFKLSAEDAACPQCGEKRRLVKQG